MNFFYKERKLVFFHFKQAKWYLLFFLLLYIILLFIGFIFLEISHEKQDIYKISIGVYRILYSDGSYPENMFFRITKYMFFSTPAFIYFAIVIIFLVKKYIISEIKNGIIFYWITSDNSRTKIMSSKIVFILSFILIIFLPQFLLTTLFGILSGDANLYFWYLFNSEFNFLLSLILFASLFIFLGTIFSYKSKIFDICCSFIIIYFIVTYILSLLTFINPYLKDLFDKVHFFSFDLFSQFILDFKEPVNKKLIPWAIYDSSESYYAFDAVITKWYITLSVILFNMFSATLFLFLSTNIFKNKNIFA